MKGIASMWNTSGMIELPALKNEVSLGAGKYCGTSLYRSVSIPLTLTDIFGNRLLTIIR